MNILLPVGVVECYGIDHVPVTFQGVKLLSRRGVPQFACPVVAPCDKANTRNVNGSRSENGSLFQRASFLTCKIITPSVSLFTVETVYAGQTVKPGTKA